MQMRVISWIKAAQKEFDSFPLEAKKKFVRALKIAAKGSRNNTCQEFAPRFRSD